MHISYSRYSCYLSCPYKHHLRYNEGISSATPARPLHFGSDFHKLLEVRKDKKRVKEEWRRMRDEFYAMPLSWQMDLGERYPEDLKVIFEDYMNMWKGTPLPDETEHPFELNIGKENGEDILFVGVIDELYKTKKGIEIGEHKTFSRPPDMNTLVMNTQKSLYCKAAELIWGKLPIRIRWDYIRSTPAKWPVWLEKSHRFSAAASKDITPASWLRACKDKGITDEETLKQGSQYAGNENNYFFRVQQDIYPEMVEDVYNGFVYTCRDIINRSRENKVKNITKECAWCEYRDICMAELSGNDREYVIDWKYKRREETKNETDKSN